ncbi:MAG: hypothetical protein WBI20_07490 [Burkholderiaceae bacterium]
MHFLSITVLFVVLGLGACSPSFNWREVRLDDSGLLALLPCKPDRGSRLLPVAATERVIHMAGCEAGGALFAVSTTELSSPDQLLPVLNQWRHATLSQLRAQVSSAQVFVVKGAIPLPQSELLLAQGVRADGSAVQAQLLWFARGSRIFNAVVYSDTVKPDVAQTFFASLQLQ